jgi:zinc transporter ZupT
MIYAGIFLSVIAGFALSYVVKPENRKRTRAIVTFSGAYLFSISVLHLFPEVYFHGDEHSHRLGIFILAGFLTQFVLEFLSKGLEHGHIHFDKKGFPFLMIIGLFIHAFVEGLPLGKGASAEFHHHDLRENLFLGILIHKLPIAFILSGFLRANYNKLSLTLLVVALFALMTPLGMWVSEMGLGKKIPTEDVLAFTLGIFLHVSTTIMFESSESHHFNLQKVIMTITGIAAAILSTMIW